jgi:abequosyltransferase
MKINRPFLSLCIPTYNRLDILRNTIESIYSDLDGVDLADFEVVISDNEPNQSARETVENFKFENIRYYSTDCDGFLNSYHSLKCGTGLFLKLHNNYTKLRARSLKFMIEDIKDNSINKPVVFYTDGLQQIGKIRKITNFDTFMFELSYFSSWSSGFGIWKEDFDRLSDSIVINKYFPQTSLLLTQFRKSEFIINDMPFFINQSVPNKGGYNIFKVFSIDYISLISESNQRKEISSMTLNKIKSDLLLNYLTVRYFKTVVLRIDNFERSDIRKSIEVNYSIFSYYLMIVVALLSPFRYAIRKVKVALYEKP